MDKNLSLKIFLVTFGLFTTEAIIHYNIGVHKDPNETRKFVFPPAKDFIKLAVVVAVFSMLNGVIIKEVTKA